MTTKQHTSDYYGNLFPWVSSLSSIIPDYDTYLVHYAEELLDEIKYQGKTHFDIHSSSLSSILANPQHGTANDYLGFSQIHWFHYHNPDKILKTLFLFQL